MHRFGSTDHPIQKRSEWAVFYNIEDRWLNPITRPWRDGKMAAHQHFPSNLTEPEKSFREDWQNIPKSESAELAATAIAAKAASNKYPVKCLNTDVSSIF